MNHITAFARISILLSVVIALIVFVYSDHQTKARQAREDAMRITQYCNSAISRKDPLCNDANGNDLRQWATPVRKIKEDKLQ